MSAAQFLFIRFSAYRLAAVPQSPGATSSGGGRRRGVEPGRGGGAAIAAHPATATAAVPPAATATAGRGGSRTGGRGVRTSRHPGGGRRSIVCPARHGSHDSVSHQPAGTLRHRR